MLQILLVQHIGKHNTARGLLHPQSCISRHTQEIVARRQKYSELVRIPEISARGGNVAGRVTLPTDNSCADGDDDHGGEDHVESDNRNDELGDPGDQDDSDGGHEHDVFHQVAEESPKYKCLRTQPWFSFCGRFKKR